MELQSILRTLYNVEEFEGCTEEEIRTVRDYFGALPETVESFWRTFGHTLAQQATQDTWRLPQDWDPDDEEDSSHLILLDENQGCCRAGVRREDLTQPDPPVYTQIEDDDPWILSADHTSEFLEAALIYESVFNMEYTSEGMFWLPKQDLAKVQSQLTKYTAVLKNWMFQEITFYGSQPDQLMVLMDLEEESEEYEVFCGAVTQESLDPLLEITDGLEAI